MDLQYASLHGAAATTNLTNATAANSPNRQTTTTHATTAAANANANASAMADPTDKSSLHPSKPVKTSALVRLKKWWNGTAEQQQQGRPREEQAKLQMQQKNKQMQQEQQKYMQMQQAQENAKKHTSPSSQSEKQGVIYSSPTPVNAPSTPIKSPNNPAVSNHSPQPASSHARNSSISHHESVAWLSSPMKFGLAFKKTTSPMPSRSMSNQNRSIITGGGSPATASSETASGMSTPVKQRPQSAFHPHTPQGSSYQSSLTSSPHASQHSLGLSSPSPPPPGSASAFHSPSPPVIANYSPKGSPSTSSTSRRMPMSFLSGTNPAALRANMTPPKQSTTPNLSLLLKEQYMLSPMQQSNLQQIPASTTNGPSAMSSKEGHSLDTAASSLQQRLESVAQDIPSRTRKDHNSGDVGSSLTAITPSTSVISTIDHLELDDHMSGSPTAADDDVDAPLMIAGSPWWRHDQKDVDLALKANRAASLKSSSRAVNIAGPLVLQQDDSAALLTTRNSALVKRQVIQSRDIFGTHASNSTSNGSLGRGPNSALPVAVPLQSSNPNLPPPAPLLISPQSAVTTLVSPAASNAAIHSHSDSPQMLNSRLHRDVIAADGKYKRKLKKEQDQSIAASVGGSGGIGIGGPHATSASISIPLPISNLHHHRAASPGLSAAYGSPLVRSRAQTPSGNQSDSEDTPQQDMPPSSPLTVPNLQGSRSASPSVSVLPVLLQPSGSEKFWYSVVLASWPRMLHSSLLRKMIERDGVPPMLRHKVWGEILKIRTGVGAAEILSKSTPKLAGGPNSATPTLTSPPSSMASDIRRMQAEPGRRNSEITHPTQQLQAASSGALSPTLSSSHPNEVASPALLSPSTPSPTAASAGGGAISINSPLHQLQPIERCTFCLFGVGEVCICPNNPQLLLPLARPSAPALTCVLEGCVALREERESSHGEGSGGGDASTAYVQGMSYLAEVLLCYMPPVTAIEALVALFEQSAFFRAYLNMRVEEITLRFRIFETTLHLNSPFLFEKFKSFSLPPDCYYLEFLATLCSKQLPPEWVGRIWDGFLLSGEIFILKTVIALLQLLQPMLLRMNISQLVRALREPNQLGVFNIQQPASLALGSHNPSVSAPPARSSRAQTPVAGIAETSTPAAAPVSTLITPRPLFFASIRSTSPAVAARSPSPTHASGSAAPTENGGHKEHEEHADAEVAAINPSQKTDHAPMHEHPSASTNNKSSSTAVHVDPPSSRSLKRSSVNSSWWWPFSSKSSAADEAAHVNAASPMPSISITLQDLLMCIQQVEMPPHAEDELRNSRGLPQKETGSSHRHQAHTPSYYHSKI